jgi:hypothetical protein
MNSIYEMTISKHLKYIWISLMVFLIVPGISLYSMIRGNGNGPFITFFFIWIFLGALYYNGFRLHISYYLNDKYKRVLIDGSNMTIILKTNTFLLGKEDIESITIHHSGLNNRTPWNDYEYSVFKFNNERKFTITCLSINSEQLKAHFPDVEMIHKYHFVASLSKSR